MINSVYDLKLGTYFKIICSEDLKYLGIGTKRQQLNAWKKIRKEDDEINPLSSKEKNDEYMADYRFYVNESIKVRLCTIALTGKDSKKCINILNDIGIFGNDRESLLRSSDSFYKGLISKIDELKLILEKKSTKINMQDCLKELSLINKYFPVNINSTLAEYRGAISNYLELYGRTTAEDN